jgi:hypothetical protein
MKSNKKISNRLMMYIVVLTLCLANQTILGAFTAIWDLVQAFKVKKEHLESLIKQRLLIETGLAKDKTKTKQQLADLAYTIGAALYAYADSVSDFTLREKVQYHLWELLRMRGTDMTQVCVKYHELATDNLANLAGYGIDITMLNTFSAAITLFSDNVPKPVGAIEHRAVLTDEIDKTDKEITSLLKNQLDKGMAVVKAGNPDLVSEYFNSRRIWDMGMHHEQAAENPDEVANMTGNIMDTDGNPIEDVEAVLSNENNSYTDYTDEDGDLLFEGIAKGSYTLTLSYFGKKTITDTL